LGAWKKPSEPGNLKLLKEFEWRFPRSSLPCDPVLKYPVEKYSDEASWVSEDVLDLGLAEDLDSRFGH
jgi:hypothetical protein